MKNKGCKSIRKKVKGTDRGKGYRCTVCGLAVTVDEECGCIDACDIICCGEQMKQR